MRNALRSYDPEKRNKIHVIATAPGAYIDEDLCGSVVHLVGKWDIVPWLDFFGRIKNSHNTIILPRHKEANWLDVIDHSFQSPTYKEKRLERYEHIIDNFKRA